MARYHVINPETAKYFEKPNGSKVWNLTEREAMRISQGAIIIALDERNFNESLNSYYCGKLYKQLAYDERNGWVS